MKLLIVGDPHGKLGKIKNLNLKNTDLILITGDLGKADSARKFYFKNFERKQKDLPEIKYNVALAKKIWNEPYKTSISVIKYLSKFAPVYTIMGNVTSKNKWVKEDEKKFKIKLPHLIPDLKKLKDVYIVKNQLRIINNLRIGFLEYFLDESWVREFDRKNRKLMKRAKKESTKAKKILNRFGKIDVLICHQPPYGILDKVNSKDAPKNWKGKHAGSKVVLNYIRKYQPRYVFCGHIHEGKGKTQVGKTEIYNVGCEGDYILIEIKFIPN